MLCLGAGNFWQNLCFKYQTMTPSLKQVCKSKLSWNYLHNSVTASTAALNRLNLLATARRTRALYHTIVALRFLKEFHLCSIASWDTLRSWWPILSWQSL